MKFASANDFQMSHTPLHLRQVHTITDRFAMANTYLLNGERMVIVDPQSELNVQLLCSYLQRVLHRSLDEVDLIVLTHLHTNQTHAIEVLQRLCKIPVAASIAVSHFLREERQGGTGPARFASPTRPGRPKLRSPLEAPSSAYSRRARQIDVWLEDVSGLPAHPEWRVIASPGHTPDSLCLYNPFSYELLCGDIVVTIEDSAPLLRNGIHRHQLQETLSVLRSLLVHYLYPGHGRPVIGRHPLRTLEIE